MPDVPIAVTEANIGVQKFSLYTIGKIDRILCLRALKLVLHEWQKLYRKLTYSDFKD